MAVIPSAPATGLTKSKLQLATAESANVLAGKTYYSKDKTLKTGTMVNRTAETTVKSPSGWPVVTTTSPYFNTCSDGVDRIDVFSWNRPGYYESGTAFGVPATSFGNAKPSQVLSGATFTSAAGLKVKGTFNPNIVHVETAASSTNGTWSDSDSFLRSYSGYAALMFIYTGGSQNPTTRIWIEYNLGTHTTISVPYSPTFVLRGLNGNSVTIKFVRNFNSAQNTWYVLGIPI